jgi:hypothetical protein
LADQTSRNLNPGIYVNEIDKSARTSVPRYDDVIHFIPGFSKTGPQNRPILIETPTDFIKIFGDIDYKLERKESYFHRTALKMLETGPAYCMSILKTDPIIDKLNWVTMSSATHLQNENTRTNPYDQFFNKLDFWKKSEEDLINVSKRYSSSPTGKILSFVNMSNDNITLWVFKSNLPGFNQTVEDWYGADNKPSFLHPKELISDFMVRVVVVKGDWTNYASLSVDIKWSRYFNIQGLRKDRITDFLNDIHVTLITDLHVSLIPDFKDALGRDLFIQSVINSNSDKTGLFAALDIDQYETDFRNGFVDLIGYNTIERNIFGLNFLSYKEQIVDELLIDEKFIDQAGNSWGDPAWESENRSSKNADGYINDTQLKPLIISQTSTFVVKPFVLGSNSYAIIKGKKIAIKQSQNEFQLELNKIISPGNKFILALVMTEAGVDYRLSVTVPFDGNYAFPKIDVKNEYVIGYYTISQDLSGEYETLLNGVSITEDDGETVDDGLFGWIPCFSNQIETVPKIRFDIVNANQIELRFEKCLNIIENDYHQNRIYYLYFQLYKNLVERVSIVLDSLGYKRTIANVENIINNQDRLILLTIEENDPAIILPPNNINGWISIYYNDLEFLYQTAKYINTDSSPYTFPVNGGRLGPESYLYKSYYEGLVSTGDRVFIEIEEESNIEFRNINGQYYIIFNNPILGNYSNKIYVNNTLKNKGIFTISSQTTISGKQALIVIEEIVNEDAELVQFFDANLERYFKFYFLNKELYVQYEEKSLNQDNLLKNIKKTDEIKFKRTLEIEGQLDPFTILVDYKRYAGNIQTGQYLQAQLSSTDINSSTIQRGWCRILEVYPYDLDNTLLTIHCDDYIQVNDFINNISFGGSYGTSGTDYLNKSDKQCNWFVSIDDWVKTYKGFFLKGFTISNESIPNGTEEKLAEILTAIAPGTGLYNALSNVNKITYRYLIDSFGLGFNEQTKLPLAKICDKHMSLGFLNLPSIKQFKNYTGLNFLTLDGRFDLSKLLSGGHKNSFAGVYFTLISDQSSSSIGYYFPYVKTEDINLNRPIFVPPAMFAADSYMRNKWQVKIGDIRPWSIVAGWSLGRVNDISGLEIEFSDDDLGLLNQSNINGISKDKDSRYFIFAENTSYPFDSSLGSIHVREALISFEEEMRNMLLNFHWSFNTKENRETIVKQANVIAAKYISQSAFYDIRNIMDESNNNKEMIDAGIGLLDTYVEAVQGMGVIILNVNVLRTGQVNSQLLYK